MEVNALSVKPTLNKIKETAINVKDIERTKHFYHHILGLEIISQTDKFIFFRVGPDLLLCFDTDKTKDQISPPPHAARGIQHFAFECSEKDYERWKNVISENNIEIEDEITWESGKKSFYFRDPDGHCLEIIEPLMWGF
ncbi:MAG: VOC family protein [Chitinophagales bacterium]|nr:VOC family protein [Chitinophagales bacterium]